MLQRESHQEGSIHWKNNRPTLRYMLKVGERWVFKRETLPEWVVTEKQANQYRQERMVEINRLNNGSEQEVVLTLGEFIKQRWPWYLKKREVKPSTAYTYDSMFKCHILPAFGSGELEAITPDDLSVFFEKLDARVSKKYWRNLYGLLNLVFKYAVDLELITKSPLRATLHKPARRPRPKKPALSFEEVRSILAQVPGEYELLFLTAAITGLRAGELLGLRWRDFDAAGRTLRIASNVWRMTLVTPKTEASIRTIHVPPPLSERLEAHHQASAFSGDDHFVFARADGLPYDQDHLRRIVLYPALERAGIARSSRGHGLHMFRHTAGSLVHELTSDLKLTQEFLAHSQVATTADIYVHVSAEKASEATRLLASKLLTVAEDSSVGEIASELIQ